MVYNFGSHSPDTLSVHLMGLISNNDLRNKEKKMIKEEEEEDSYGYQDTWLSPTQIWCLLYKKNSPINIFFKLLLYLYFFSRCKI